MDFLAVLDRARNMHLDNQYAGANVAGSQENPIPEESKDPSGQFIEEEKHESRVSRSLTTGAGQNNLMIDTSGLGGGALAARDPSSFDINDLRRNKTRYLDPATNQLLREMYTNLFPNIISTILRLKHSKNINDIDCKRLVENINGRFIRTVIQILSDKEEFEPIF